MQMQKVLVELGSKVRCLWEQGKFLNPVVTALIVRTMKVTENKSGETAQVEWSCYRQTTLTVDCRQVRLGVIGLCCERIEIEPPRAAQLQFVDICEFRKI